MTSYLVWVDDGAGNWSVPTSISPLSLTFQASGLTAGEIYGFKVQAVNAIGDSVDSDTQYFVCADLPSAPDAPVFE